VSRGLWAPSGIGTGPHSWRRKRESCRGGLEPPRESERGLHEAICRAIQVEGALGPLGDRNAEYHGELLIHCIVEGALGSLGDRNGRARECLSTARACRGPEGLLGNRNRMVPGMPNGAATSRGFLASSGIGTGSPWPSRACLPLSGGLGPLGNQNTDGFSPWLVEQGIEGAREAPLGIRTGSARGSSAG
jgi:hypothetical protein